MIYKRKMKDLIVLLRSGRICQKKERPSNRGQALVEFTLIFALLLVILFIPADFGIAFFTSQLAQNAARDGARIAAADPTLTSQTGSCTLPCAGQPNGSILKTTADRLSSALLPGATVTVTYPAPGTGGGVGDCNAQVQVTVNGNYNYFFYQLVNLIGGSVTPTSNIVRTTRMRWEHQSCI